MMQQVFKQPVDQVIQASSVIQKFNDKGRALTENERRDLNKEVQRVAKALGQNGWLVWRTLHDVAGVGKVEEMRIADLPPAHKVLNLLFEESELLKALRESRKLEKQAVALAAALREEVDALKHENLVLLKRIEGLAQQAVHVSDAATTSVDQDYPQPRKRLKRRFAAWRFF